MFVQKQGLILKQEDSPVAFALIHVLHTNTKKEFWRYFHLACSFADVRLENASRYTRLYIFGDPLLSPQSR